MMAGIAQAQNYLASENPQHNIANALDVDNNGLITARDLALVLDAMERAHALSPGSANPLATIAGPISAQSAPTFYPDTNNDGIVSPMDPLLLLDHFAVAAVAAPEPSSLISAGLGLAMLVGYAWRRRRARG